MRTEETTAVILDEHGNSLNIIKTKLCNGHDVIYSMSPNCSYNVKHGKISRNKDKIADLLFRDDSDFNFQVWDSDLKDYVNLKTM